MLYFAYGSNMDRAQMAARCPSASVMGIARLPDHKLCFPRASRARGCGVASIEPTAGEVVWGVVYDLSDADWAALDGAEGFRPDRPFQMNAYVRRSCRVWLVRDQAEMIADTETYIANSQPNPPPPSEAYMRHLIDGAIQNGLPPEYIKRLRNQEIAE